jgi:hypothetical protein
LDVLLLLLHNSRMPEGFPPSSPRGTPGGEVSSHTHSSKASKQARKHLVPQVATERDDNVSHIHSHTFRRNKKRFAIYNNPSVMCVRDVH